MSHWGDARPERFEAAKAVVLAFITDHGPIPRADIWQSLDGRVSVGHVDRSLKSLLAEGRIRADKAELAKPVDYPWTQKALRYTATVYSVVRHDG